MFKKNDKVIINENSEYAAQGLKNGTQLIGLVTSVSPKDTYSIHVDWHLNGSLYSENVYRVEDLIPLEKFTYSLKIPKNKVLVSLRTEEFPSVLSMLQDPFSKMLSTLKNPISKTKLYYLEEKKGEIIKSNSPKSFITENVYLLSLKDFGLLESKIYFNDTYRAFNKCNRFENITNNLGKIFIYTKR